METKYIAAIAAFFGGALISLVNAVITAKQAKKETQIPVSAAIVRQALNIIYFVGTYFLMKKTGIDYMLPLIGAAVGLTVPSILFAITIAKHMKGDD